MRAVLLGAKPADAVPAFPRDRLLLQSAFRHVRAGFGQHIDGLTHVSSKHAIFQSCGDPKLYAVEVTPEQAAALGCVAL
jgi:hypothetical protein